MKLHEDKEQFEAAIRITASMLDIKIKFVEKDYWICQVLQRLSRLSCVERWNIAYKRILQKKCRHCGRITRHYGCNNIYNCYICSLIAHNTTIMENIYMLSDDEICRRIGAKVKRLRLRQDFTQMSLAEESQVSVSTLKKIEGGTISSFDALMRVLRILGELEKLTPLIEEDELSPNEYFELVESAKKKQRKRASSKKHDNIIKDKEESEW